MILTKEETKKIVDKIILEYPKEMEDYKNGNDKIIDFFVGKVNAEADLRANPKEIIEMIKQRKTPKFKILSYGDNPKTSTGYGCVWDNLLTQWCKLKPDWEFFHVGWQGRDREHKTVEGYTMLPMAKAEYGYDTVYLNLMKLKPDFLVTLCDVGWQTGFMESVHEAKKAGWKGKWIMYTPVDTDGWALTWDEAFNAPDINVAMAKFGYDRMIEHKVPEVRLIEHGVDTKMFFPREDKAKLKEGLLPGKFVVGFVGRNQKRKMLDRLLLGFKEFAKDKSDVVLLLHTDSEPPSQGWSLKYMQWMHGLTDKIKLTKTELDIIGRQTITTKGMNEIYNLMDVFCYPTGGEGFGLPGIETQAAGVPLLMANNSTALDLCKPENKIDILEDKYGRKTMDIGTNGVWFYYPDDLHMAKQLQRFYDMWKNDKAAYEKECKDAREFSLKYDWEPLCKKWIDLFEQEA